MSRQGTTNTSRHSYAQLGGAAQKNTKESKMLESTTIALVNSLNSNILGSLLNNTQIRIWGVFLLCLFFSASGVVLSFLLLGTVIKGTRLWGFGLVIAVIMLGISYGA